MDLEFNKKFDDLLKKAFSQAKKSNKQTALILNTTTKKSEKTAIILPIKKTEHCIFLGITIFEMKIISNILNKIDGKINYVLVDGEQKNEKLINLMKYVKKNIHKSEILSFKTNDYTAESADIFLQQLIDFSKKRKVAIIGAGNIGSKLALKLIERGIDVYISKTKYSDSVKIANALNLIKPNASKAKIIAKSNSNIAKECNVLIGFSNKPSIEIKMVKQMSKNGIIIDGGIGTIHQDAIEFAQKRKIKIFRLDIRAGFSGYMTTLFKTKELLRDTIGAKKIKNIQIISGGFYGKIGDIVVDNLASPTEIIGIADGKGGLKRNEYSSTDKIKLKTVNSWINKNN